MDTQKGKAIEWYPSVLGLFSIQVSDLKFIWRNGSLKLDLKHMYKVNSEAEVALCILCALVWSAVPHLCGIGTNTKK